MRFLYLVLIRPIELLFGFFFGAFYRLTGDYGLSLIMLSVAMTALTAPLYYLAERWKREEEEVAYRMRRDLASVKRNYTGQKRFYLTRNVHRLFGYSPLLQLKASFGLLVQIPFFFGAYELLSHYEALRGHAFLFIADLGKEDGLLGGVNLLPFAMTAINLASSVAYTRTMSLRKNATMVAMALLFLVLLYDRPAALLVYWSMNNVLSLGKNLFFPAKRAQAPNDDEGPGAVAAGLAWLRELYDGSLYRPALLLAILFIVVAQSWWLTFHLISYEYCFIGSVALAVFLSLFAAIGSFLRQKPRRAIADLLPLIATWLFFAASAWILVFDRKQNALVSNRNIKMLSTLLVDIAAWGAAARMHPRGKGARPESEAKAGFGLYAGSLAYIGLMLFALSPLRVYFSSPSDMGVMPLQLVLGNLPALGCFFALGCLPLIVDAFRREHCAIRGAEELLIAVIVAGAVYAALTGSRYGVLNDFTLEKDFLLDRPPLWQFAADIAIIFVAFIAARYLRRRRRGVMTIALAIMVAIAVVQVGVAAARVEPGSLAAMASSSSGGPDASPPADVADLHRFSRGGENVVFIIADMFNGNYLGRALDEDFSRAEKLEGFTWLPNTLAAGSVTATSLPSIYGGRDYEPGRLDALPGTGKEKLGRAAQGFFGRLMDAGFSVTAVDALYADYASFGRDGKLRLSSSSHYVGLWKEKRGIGAGSMEGSKNALLTMLSLFGASPYMLKARIYDQGSWIVFRRSYQFGYIARKTMQNYAYLDLLPELSSSSGNAAPRALFIHTQFTHEPFGIDASESIIKDEYPDPRTKSFVDARSAYLTARAFVDTLLRWTDWMKREGVYDNTMIVVLSDHGNNSVDQGIKVGPKLDNPMDMHALSRAHALLLYKPFGARGKLQIDTRLAGTADASGILFAGLAGKDPSAPEPASSETRDFAVIHGDWADFLTNERSDFTVYHLKGDMNDPTAWSKD